MTSASEADEATVHPVQSTAALSCVGQVESNGSRVQPTHHGCGDSYLIFPIPDTFNTVNKSTPFLPGWRPHGWVPVHSTPVLPKWEEAVGSSQAPQPNKPNTQNTRAITTKTQAEGRFLTERHISWMIYKNFTICGEAIQDFGELIKLQLTSGSVQLFDTKWAKIRSAMTERPAANLLERLDRMQLEKSDGLLFLMPVYNPETVTKQYPYECAKLRDFVQRHIEQKNISHSKSQKPNGGCNSIGSTRQRESGG